MPFASLSLRARLILAIGLLLGGALIAFDLFLYTVLSNHLARDFDNSLRVSAADISAALTPDQGEKMDVDDIRPGILEPTAVDDASKPGVYVQILDVTGHAIASSGTKLPVDRAQVRRVIAGSEVVDWVGRDERLRMLSRPVLNPTGAIVGVIQVAQSGRFLDAALGEVRTLMAVGTILTLLGSCAIGWLLIGRALRPITSLTAAADHIVATGRLDARIVQTGPTDEVGTLVSSFNLMVERLEQAFEQQRRLLADTSHELRNPLTAIRANLEIIASSDGSDDVYDAASEAKDEVLRMSRLVNDLLLLGRTDSADAVERKPTTLAPLVARIAERARLVSPGQTIEIMHLDDVQVQGDADRLYQAIWNLVENALRYTPPSSHVRLSLLHLNGLAVISVQDDGPGIAREHLPRLFDRFYRIDKARSRGTGGVGLGLAIVKWIAEAHGGTVTVSSKIGEGTTFEVSLPALMAPAPQRQPVRRAVLRPTPAPAVESAGRTG